MIAPAATHKPRVWSLAVGVVRAGEIVWAIKTFSPQNSLGPNAINRLFLQEELNHFLGPLTIILKASIALRHVPQPWKNPKLFSSLNQVAIDTF